MSRVYKCDRCGKYYNKFFRRIAISAPETVIPDEYDLCETCYKDLKKFFEEVNYKCENKNLLRKKR